MAEKNEDRPNGHFTIDELKFLLQKLHEIKTNSSLSEYEIQIVNLLIKQIEQLLNQTNISDISEDKKLIKKYNKDSYDLNHYGMDEKKTLKSSLLNKIDDYVILILKTSGKLCKLEGILSNVYQDFIVLINNQDLFNIKINEIASVKTRINNDHSKTLNETITFKDQYYLEEEYFSGENKPDNNAPKNKKVDNPDSSPEESNNNNVKIKKQQKEYSIEE